MRRALPCLVALIVLLTATGWAPAEEPTSATKVEKDRSEFGGSISIEGVYRDKIFDQIWDRSGGGLTDAQQEGFLNGVFSFNATVMPIQTVTFFLELRTAPDAFGQETHRIGDNNNVPQFREAWVKVEDVLGKWSEGRGLKLQVGLQPYRYELRNLGRDVFFMDPGHSENPFTGIPGLPAHAGGVGAGSSLNSFMGGNPWINNLAGIVKESETGGFKLALTPHRNAHIDMGAFIMMEGGVTDVELGTQVYYFNFDFEFDLNKKKPGLKKEVTFEDTSLFNIIITGIQGRRTFIGDGGLGVDLLFVWDTADLEVYLEGHYQNGEYSKIKVAGHEDMTPHEAYAAMFGFRIKYKDKSGMNPYFDVSGWFLSGDEGDPHEKSQDFISFESVNTTLILESDLGFDIDCNYFAVKAEIGTHFPGKAKDVSIQIKGGFFNLVQAPLGAVDPDEKALGIEVDAMLTWAVSETSELFLGGGALIGAKFFEVQYGTEDMAFMGMVGVNARF